MSIPEEESFKLPCFGRVALREKSVVGRTGIGCRVPLSVETRWLTPFHGLATSRSLAAIIQRSCRK
jgi:hypothetical protein